MPSDDTTMDDDEADWQRKISAIVIDCDSFESRDSFNCSIICDPWDATKPTSMTDCETETAGSRLKCRDGDWEDSFDETVEDLFGMDVETIVTQNESKERNCETTSRKKKKKQG